MSCFFGLFSYFSKAKCQSLIHSNYNFKLNSIIQTDLESQVLQTKKGEKNQVKEE